MNCFFGHRTGVSFPSSFRLWAVQQPPGWQKCLQRESRLRLLLCWPRCSFHKARLTYPGAVLQCEVNSAGRINLGTAFSTSFLGWFGHKHLHLFIQSQIILLRVPSLHFEVGRAKAARRSAAPWGGGYIISTDPDTPGQEVERHYVSVLKTVKQAVTIPVAVKLSPYFSAVGHMATQLVDAGADGLVLFNRFYQPDIDLGQMELQPNLELSTAKEIRLPLLWIGVLSGRLRTSLGASSGVESADEVIKYLLAGADVVLTTSALLRHGVGHMQALLDGLKSWLVARDLDTLDSIRGRLSQCNITDPTAFARANYVRILQNYQSDR